MTLPGQIGRPGGNIGDRPGIGGRPGIGDRPGIADRPIIGGGRPGIGDRPIIGGGRPGIGDRPIIGGGRPGIGDRPIIGGGNNLGNINIGNDVNIGINRVNRWGSNWGYAGGRGHWGNYWYDHHIHGHHHGWYHGCWSGHWGGSWYVPFVYGATAWGLSPYTSAWGYSYSYANPYYVASAAATTPTYDYSQPIIVNYTAPVQSVETSQEGAQAAAQPAAEEPSMTAGYQLFDEARAKFQQGDYRDALSKTEQAIQAVPKDPVLHEFGALCLFALGEYGRSASVLNALLAVAPGMDWATLSSLYPNTDVYTQQLRKLEAHCKQNPSDAAADFVLAYHYLICGQTETAVKALQAVVKAQPQDVVAQRMLAALTADSSQPPAADESPPVPPLPAEATSPAEAAKPAAAASEGPTTDLVGSWRASQDGNTFELTIDEAGKFTWKATPQGKQPTTVSGNYSVAGDALVLESADQGTMAGRVTSDGPDRFQFLMPGGPPNDKGLTFERIKPNASNAQGDQQ